MPKLLIPSDLSERFLPHEAPTFEVILSAGEVRLWKTTTSPYRIEESEFRAKVHYHVTRGEEAAILLMRNIDMAVANFDLEVSRGASHG